MREIQIVLDNLSAHKTKAVAEFLEANPKVRLHFTPTYSSWLNQVEIWFSKIARDVIARGFFTSVSDLVRKLRKYIRATEPSNLRSITHLVSYPSQNQPTSVSDESFCFGSCSEIVEAWQRRQVR